MTPPEFSSKLIALDNAVGRALLAKHAFEDAPDAPGRIIAGRALRDAVRDAARISHELDVELRTLGARS